MAIPILSTLLSGPLKDIIDSVGGLLDKVTTTDEERLAAKKEFLDIQAKLYAAALDADAKILQAQSAVVIAEAQSESWLARNWRPITMLTFVFIIAWNYIFSQIFNLRSLEIVPDMWVLLKLGIGGYIAGRSVEKIIPSVADAVGAVREDKKK